MLLKTEKSSYHVSLPIDAIAYKELTPTGQNGDPIKAIEVYRKRLNQKVSVSFENGKRIVKITNPNLPSDFTPLLYIGAVQSPGLGVVVKDDKSQSNPNYVTYFINDESVTVPYSQFIASVLKQEIKTQQPK